MPSMRFPTLSSPTQVSIEGTLGLPWRLSLNGELFTTGQGDQTVRLGILTGAEVVLTLDVISFPLVRETVYGLVPTPPPPKPPEVPPPPPQSTPTPGGYQKIEDKGTVCEILRKDFGARYFYFLRNKVTGEISQGWENGAELWQAKGDQMGCYAPAPQTLPDWQKSISDRLAAGFDQLSEYVSGISKRVDKIQNGLDGIWDKLEGWLVERIVRILLIALNNEAKNSRGKP